MWVESMEKKLDGSETMAMKEKWEKHCIFRVPPHFKVGRRDVFTPQRVALGPFHHNDVALRPMEEHKLRAVQQVLHRAKKPLRELAVVVEDMTEELEDAYAGLGDDWRGENRGKFLEMMVADSCFLLEMMQNNGGYNKNDPVFGKHAKRHIKPFMQRDMLMIENQLPLALLQRIVEFEEGRPLDELSINKIVATFLCEVDLCDVNVGPPLGLHPLDIYRRSLLQRTPSPADRDGATRLNEQGRRPQRERYSSCCLPTRTERRPVPRFRDTRAAPSKSAAAGTPSLRSAKMLWESGVRFKPSKTDRLDDIHFNECRWSLEMPVINLDDSTEHKWSNLMAFEALHVAKDNDCNPNGVTAFVLFMRDLVDSEDDVAVLREGKVLEHDLAGSDKAVVEVFNRLTMDVAKFGDSNLCLVRDEVEKYCNEHKCRVFIFKSWAKLKSLYLSSPWAFIALIFSLFLIATDITQTVFAVRSYAHEIKKDRREHAQQAPHVGRWIGH